MWRFFVMNDSLEKTGKTLAVIGLGYVGLPLALLAERKGYRVWGIDIDEQKVETINRRISPFVDGEVQQQLSNSSLVATRDFSVVRNVSIIVICVPTPVHDDHRPDLRPVTDACVSLAPYLQSNQLVIVESTVNPGVCETTVLQTLEQHSHLKAGRDFFLAHCPERINPGDVQWRVENIPRVVGSLEEVGLRRAVAFYSSILEAEVKPMGSLREAEAVKVVENAFRDVNIAFVNELAMSFQRVDIDVLRVIEGAATKPFSFLPHFPGCGVGGHCIPVDPYYLIDYAKQNGFEHEFLSLARRINNRMPQYVVDLLLEAFKVKLLPLSGTKVTVLGLAYKAEIDDDRESPAYAIIALLRHCGFSVTAYDPFVRHGKEPVAENLTVALTGAKAVVVVTAHKIFSRLRPADFLAAGVEIIIDGRNCLDKSSLRAAGLYYRGVGR